MCDEPAEIATAVLPGPKPLVGSGDSLVRDGSEPPWPPNPLPICPTLPDPQQETDPSSRIAHPC